MRTPTDGFKGYRDSMLKARHLIGAHGMFWARDAIDWDAGRGQTYQLLGRQGERYPRLEFCDFRKARGVYLLYNDFRATYVGRARGNEGLGSRLKNHHRDDRKDWNRFCWFSFDSVIRNRDEDYWSSIYRDVGDRGISADLAIDELEALMIAAFGLSGSQNVMRLPEAREPWTQLTVDDCGPGGVGRLAPDGIRMPSLREGLAW